MLARTMQQVQIPIAAVANVSVVSNTWRNVHTGHYFFQFLHGSSQQCSAWTLNVPRVMTVVPICASACTDIFIVSLILNCLFPFIIHISPSCCEAHHN
jgi:hypothetical protein